jgi:hypothetical protein
MKSCTATPVDCRLAIVDLRLNYTNFMKIGQPKLSERKSRSGLFGTATYLHWRMIVKLDNYG